MFLDYIQYEIIFYFFIRRLRHYYIVLYFHNIIFGIQNTYILFLVKRFSQMIVRICQNGYVIKHQAINIIHFWIMFFFSEVLKSLLGHVLRILYNYILYCKITESWSSNINFFSQRAYNFTKHNLEYNSFCMFNFKKVVTYKFMSIGYIIITA